MQATALKKTSHEDWHPADIIAALRKKGITLSGLAKAYGLKHSSGFSAALVRSFPLAEKRLADALEIEPRVIWPSRYNEDGSIKPRGFRALQFNAASVARNSKDVAAAGKARKVA